MYTLYIASSKNEELDEKDVWLDQWLYMVWRQWGTKNTEGRTEGGKNDHIQVLFCTNGWLGS